MTTVKAAIYCAAQSALGWRRGREFGDQDGYDLDDDDDAMEVSHQKQTDILVGRFITNPHTVNFSLEGGPLDIAEQYLGESPPRQRPRFEYYLKLVFCGVLILVGAGGTGKSATIGYIVLMRLAPKHEIGVSCPTNVAATNIITRLCELDGDQHLIA